MHGSVFTNILTAMEKRYQVFVSSTFEDLKDERHQVIQALLELDCIPAGMELFSASDLDQWSLITSVIDDCDYYVVIIGGRYGSTTPEGISFTEKEFDYAVSVGKPILAFLHKDPNEIPAGKTEMNQTAQSRLTKFREKAETGRVCKYWSSADDLGGQVSRALIKAIKQTPGEGWVRGRYATTTESFRELERLRRENEDLRRQITDQSNAANIASDLASGDDVIEITGQYTMKKDKTEVEWSQDLTWDELLFHLGPLMLNPCEDSTLRAHLASVLRARDPRVPHEGISGYQVSADDFQTTKIQFLALGYITKAERTGSVAVSGGRWVLTPNGESHLMNLRAIKKEKSSSK